jgi:hypothetical protein
MKIELDLTQAEFDSFFFALRMRAHRCEERAAEPGASADKVAMNEEESRRCVGLSERLMRLSRKAA